MSTNDPQEALPSNDPQEALPSLWHVAETLSHTYTDGARSRRTKKSILLPIGFAVAAAGVPVCLILSARLVSTPVAVLAPLLLIVALIFWFQFVRSLTVDGTRRVAQWMSVVQTVLRYAALLVSWLALSSAACALIVNAFGALDGGSSRYVLIGTIAASGLFSGMLASIFTAPIVGFDRMSRGVESSMAGEIPLWLSSLVLAITVVAGLSETSVAASLTVAVIISLTVFMAGSITRRYGDKVKVRADLAKAVGSAWTALRFEAVGGAGTHAKTAAAMVELLQAVVDDPRGVFAIQARVRVESTIVLCLEYVAYRLQEVPGVALRQKDIRAIENILTRRPTDAELSILSQTFLWEIRARVLTGRATVRGAVGLGSTIAEATP